MKITRALSIRQPYAEMILRGKKKIEYRSRPTNIRERVYIYASLTPGDEEAWKAIKLHPSDLPTGVLIGTVEIKDCTGKPGDYEWHLAKPVRLKKKIKPKRKPQPAWFRPF
jgi:hypothetical protein